jgi:hypothetical protein
MAMIGFRMLPAEAAGCFDSVTSGLEVWDE